MYTFSLFYRHRFKEIKMQEIIKEIVFYLVFLNITMLIAFGERDPAAFYANKSLKDMFVDARYHGRMKFDKVCYSSECF